MSLRFSQCDNNFIGSKVYFLKIQDFHFLLPEFHDKLSKIYQNEEEIFLHLNLTHDSAIKALKTPNDQNVKDHHMHGD